MGGWVTLLESGSRAILWDVIEMSCERIVSGSEHESM